MTARDEWQAAMHASELARADLEDARLKADQSLERDISEQEMKRLDEELWKALEASQAASLTASAAWKKYLAEGDPDATARNEPSSVKPKERWMARLKKRLKRPPQIHEGMQLRACMNCGHQDFLHLHATYGSGAHSAS